MAETIEVTKTCGICKGTKTLTLPKDGYESWTNGTFVQLALPGLSADDRELLISGTCGPCFDGLFAPEGDFWCEDLLTRGENL